MQPKNLDELRACVDRERGLSGRAAMGERTLAVLLDMLSRPGQAAVESISELAARNDVDPSTLTRLGKRLGFSGFAPLQRLFREHVATTQPFYSTRVKELIAAPGAVKGGSVLQRLAEEEFGKVAAVASAISDKHLQDAGTLLTKAPRVHVLGLRGSYSMSYFLGSFLSHLRDDVFTLGGPGFQLPGDLVRMRQGDILVAIAFRPYTRAVVNAVNHARKSGVRVLAITDAGSPIDVKGDEGMSLRVDQPFYMDSAMPQFLVCEALLLTCARLLGDAANQAIRNREFVNKQLDIEID